MIKVLKAKDIKGLPVLATGYKIFNSDWSPARGQQKYADSPDANITGKIYKETDCDNVGPCLCVTGLHFCTKAIDCLRYYSLSPFHKFCKVSAYGQIAFTKEADSTKACCSILKVDEVLTYKEFIDTIEAELKQYKDSQLSFSSICDVALDNRDTCNNVEGGPHIQFSKNCRGDRIYNSEAVYASRGISASVDIEYSAYIKLSSDVDFSESICESRRVSSSELVQTSSDINRVSNCLNSKHIDYSSFIGQSSSVQNSKSIRNSTDVIASANCSLSNNIFGCINSSQLANCIFCDNLHRKQYYIFNKKVSQKRFVEVYYKVAFFELKPWRPSYVEIKADINSPAIARTACKNAWASIPKEHMDYIKAMPEFNEKIWNNIINS